MFSERAYFFLSKASLKQSDYDDIWMCACDNEQDIWA